MKIAFVYIAYPDCIVELTLKFTWNISLQKIVTCPVYPFLSAMNNTHKETCLNISLYFQMVSHV